MCEGAKPATKKAERVGGAPYPQNRGSGPAGNYDLKNLGPRPYWAIDAGRIVCHTMAVV